MVDLICMLPIVVLLIAGALVAYTLTHINVSRTGAGQTLPGGATFWIEQWAMGRGATQLQPPRLSLPMTHADDNPRLTDGR